MRGLIEKDTRNAQVILPYIGGDEVNTSPTHACHRYVINFGERSEEECRRQWPDLMAIVETKVKPARQLQGSIVNPNRWWMFARPATDLVEAANGLHRGFVMSCVRQHASVAFIQSGRLCSK